MLPEFKYRDYIFRTERPFPSCLVNIYTAKRVTTLNVLEIVTHLAVKILTNHDTNGLSA